MYAGIDYSMSSPAITVGQSKDYKKCKTFFYTDTKSKVGKFGDNIFGMMMLPYETQEERFHNISEWAMSIVKKFEVVEAVVEGYSMGSKGQVFNIGENGGVLKHKLWKNDIKIFIPSPSTVKLDFTGKGNAKKDMMHDSFLEKTGVDVSLLLKCKKDKSPASDIVDSYAMLEYGINNCFK